MVELLFSAWNSLKYAFLIPLPVAGIVVLLAYLWMKPRGARSWRDLGEFVIPSRLRHARTIKTDVVSFVVDVLLVPPLGKVLGLTLSAEVFSYVLSELIGSPPITIAEPELIIPLQLVAAYFAAELFSWVRHYLHHKVPFLWEIHKAHHSSESLSVIAGFRRHPLEILITGLPFAGLMAMLFGTALYLTGGHVHPVVVSGLVVVDSAVGVVNLLYHSHVPISFGGLNRVLYAPVLHQIHHSAEPEHRDKNLGRTLSIFDWMFGTLYLPKNGEQLKARIGIGEDDIGEKNPHLTAKGFFWAPVAGFGRELMASILPGQRLTTIR